MASDTDKNLPVRAVWYLACVLAFACPAFAGDDSPQFEAADVHASVSSPNGASRVRPGRGGRYEARNASMVDLIRVAYGYTNDKILGGPNWLEMDRFDVTAQVPSGSTPDAIRLMLQGLLAERFRLVVHQDTGLCPVMLCELEKNCKSRRRRGLATAGANKVLPRSRVSRRHSRART
jgi:uncharacterized protein (TIGR03435 family)